MDKARGELRWGVGKRLEFIEFRLFWEGRVNRSDLMEQFGISVNQASADLNRYIALAPENTVYDKSLRTYVRTLENPFLVAKTDKNSTDQVVKGDPPRTVKAALVGSMPPHGSFATRLLSKVWQALSILEGRICENLKRGRALRLIE